jgi:hypothetical protein
MALTKFELGDGPKTEHSLYDALSRAVGQTVAQFRMQAISAKKTALAIFEFCNTIPPKADIFK